MSDINSEDRSIAEFKVRYSTGIHTSGRKKGQEKTENADITIIVPSSDPRYVQEYIQKYCQKWNMELLNFTIDPSPGEFIGEFNCQICGELTFYPFPTNQHFCSKYCEKKGQCR